jgi:hypothetical protein
MHKNPNDFRTGDIGRLGEGDISNGVRTHQKERHLHPAAHREDREPIGFPMDRRNLTKSQTSTKERTNSVHCDDESSGECFASAEVPMAKGSREEEMRNMKWEIPRDMCESEKSE